MRNYKSNFHLKFVRKIWNRDSAGWTDDFSTVKDFFLLMVQESDYVLDDQTWSDLDMDKNLQRMNRTFSNAGEQMLYKTARTPVFDKTELHRRDKIIQFFQHSTTERETIQCLMNYLGKKLTDSVANCLYRGVPKPPKFKWIVYPAVIAMIAALISIPFLGLVSLLPIVAVMILNMTVHFMFVQETEKAMPGIRGVARMLETSREICRLRFPTLDGYYNDFFDETFQKCGAILRKIRLYGAGRVADPLGFMAFVQVIFLSQERTYLGCSHFIEEYQEELKELYCRLGELDAFQSAAAYRSRLSPVCTPHFSDRTNYIQAVQIGHPALQNAVCNDITLDQKSLVLTGSNMSGKSTFLRTLGYNAVLAQTFCMVKAQAYESSMFCVATSISPTDDMESGKSYYMAEAEALLRMLPLSEKDTGALLIIDEIFRGTNPTERVAAASALLTYLAKRNCLTIVATHDIEITNNVRDRYVSYHFEEKVSRDTLDFDYILKPGVLKEPNGIHILEYIGYPQEITDQALETVAQSHTTTF